MFLIVRLIITENRSYFFHFFRVIPIVVDHRVLQSFEGEVRPPRNRLNWEIVHPINIKPIRVLGPLLVLIGHSCIQFFIKFLGLQTTLTVKLLCSLSSSNICRSTLASIILSNIVTRMLCSDNMPYRRLTLQTD